MMEMKKSNLIEPVLSFWKSFDLENQRLVLDQTALSIQREKESCICSRKKLAEATKKTKKLSAEEKTAEFPSLLRQYQEEIDKLTKRAKSVESAFLKLYKDLHEAPDPVPALEGFDVQEMKNLKAELEEYQQEFSDLKNQDITIRKLELTNQQLTDKMDNMVEEEVAKRCLFLEEEKERQDIEFQQREQEWERKYQQIRTALTESQSQTDHLQSQVFQFQQAKESQNKDYSQEIEKFQSQLQSLKILKMENEELRNQQAEILNKQKVSMDDLESRNSQLESTPGGFSTYEIERRQSKDRIASLYDELHSKEEEISKIQKEFESEKCELSTRLEQSEALVNDLKSELSSRPTSVEHAEALHELNILQQLEYNIVDKKDDSFNSPLEINNSSVNNGLPDINTKLEKILVSRARKIESELKGCEFDLAEKVKEVALLTESNTALESKITEQEHLISRLEDDLSSFLSSTPRSSMTAETNSRSVLLDVLSKDDSANNPPADTKIQGDGGGNMLEIVRNQRNRFRNRIKELEEDQSKEIRILNQYKNQVAKLEKENLALYEKIKYLNNFHRDIEGGLPRPKNGRDDVEKKYGKLYEEQMNPFLQFNKNESNRRISNLNSIDKILLKSAKMVLGHPLLRAFCFGYILILHFLVFATLFSVLHGCGISNH